MKRTRAYRRHQFRKAIKRAKRFLKMVGLVPTERQVHLYAECRKPCSCYICSGNKRETHKWERREAKQELRKDIEKEDVVFSKKKYSW